MFRRLRSFFEHPHVEEHISPERSLEQVHWLLEKVVEERADFLRSHSSYVFTQKLLALTQHSELLKIHRKRDHLLLSLEVYDDLKELSGCLHLTSVIKRDSGLPYHTRGLFYLDSPSQALTQVDMLLLDNSASILKAESNIPKPRMLEWIDCGVVQLPKHPQQELSLYFAAGSTFHRNRAPRLQPRRRPQPFPALTR